MELRGCADLCVQDDADGLWTCQFAPYPCGLTGFPDGSVTPATYSLDGVRSSVNLPHARAFLAMEGDCWAGIESGEEGSLAAHSGTDKGIMLSPAQRHSLHPLILPVET